MDPVTSAPRIIGWLPLIAIVLAILAGLAWRRSREDGTGRDGPGLTAVLPFGLLFVAAATAVASSAAEAALDSRVGIREASMLGLALLCATPAVGWLLSRLRWGAPGRRTFHQQIAANRAGATVLLVLLGELLAMTGFVIGATIGLFFGAAVLGGIVVAALAVASSIVAAVVTLRRGVTMLLSSLSAAPAGPEHQVLRNVVTELALAAGMPVPAVHVLDDDAPNAMAIGSDPDHAAIVVTSGLLARLDREELQGVIAHELAHIKNLDSRYGMLVAVFVGGVILLAAVFASLMSNWSIEADSLSGVVVSILLALVAALVGYAVRSLATLAALGIQASVSREREFLADASSVEITRNPLGLVGALRKVDRGRALTGVAGNTRHLWFVSPLAEDDTQTEGWLATHPAVADRIERLHALGVGEATPAPDATQTAETPGPLEPRAVEAGPAPLDGTAG
jgi:heat shock protein HtpX